MRLGNQIGSTGLAVLAAMLCVLLRSAPCMANQASSSSAGDSSFSSQEKARLADSVKAEFLHAWNGYKTYAWGHDDLKPLSKTGADWYGQSLLMTPVDAFSTMKLMHLDEQADDAKRLILDSLSFDKDIEVQVFEVNIRLLGGLLSAYQLDGERGFLELAIDLGDRLLPAFDSPTGLPYRFINLKTGAIRDSANNPAEIGTLLLEFGTLSMYTGDSSYYDTVKRAIRYLFDRRSTIDLVGTIINVDTGEWLDPESHVSARIDSYYEYMLKGWLMFGDEDLHQMWDTSIVAINRYLPETVDGHLWYGSVNMDRGERTRTEFGALDAFFPAVLSLGGDLERARMLQESCYAMWILHGIEPEVLDYTTMEVLYPGYVLRPENIESAYYLYHFTGDSRYLQMGRDYFTSITEYCRTDAAYAALESVITKKQRDSMQSFFLAETLKYAYLLFAEPSPINFDETVFNTEAHPLRIWRK